MHRLLFHGRSQCCEKAFLSNQKPELAPLMEEEKNLVLVLLVLQYSFSHIPGSPCSSPLLFSRWCIHGLHLLILPLPSWWRQEHMHFHWKILAMLVSSCSLSPLQIGGILVFPFSPLKLCSLPILKVKYLKWYHIMKHIKLIK